MPPDIQNPKTFGDFYWNAQVEADRLRSEQHEQSFSPVIQDILYSSGFSDIIPPELQLLFGRIQSPDAPDWDWVQRSFLGTIQQAVSLVAGEQMARPVKYQANQKFLNEIITPDQAITLFQRRKVTDELYLQRLAQAGYGESEARWLDDFMQPYPSLPEIIRYARYHSDAENPQPKVMELWELKPEDWDLWNWLNFEKLNTDQVQSVFRRGGWDSDRTHLELSRIGWQKEERDLLISLSYELPNPMLLLQGDLLQEASESDILDNISKAGISPVYAQQYYDGVLTKPNTQDLIEYLLRKDPKLPSLDNELRKIGIHKDYFDTYKTLAYPIPPISDLITMAVREAFTPDIAARFGQYEGLPKDFVSFAQQKGLTEEWASRYWAAHWSLPSISQGFEMLHRGIIDKNDLSLLLRALDIMPYWRDKLIEMSYHPLTRVDVRRMHLIGTLDEAGVKKAYLDVGYNEANAKLMTDFTIRYNKRSLSGFTPRDVINAYINQFIDQGKATSILRDIGVKSTEITNIMQLASNKRQWKYNTERIQAIGNLFKKERITEDQARNELHSLGLSSDFVETQVNQWLPTKESLQPATFTQAQTLKLFTLHLITETRARQELKLLKYDQERIDLLIKSVTTQTR